jgi:elongation of very long chain fatty acids protein 4
MLSSSSWWVGFGKSDERVVNWPLMSAPEPTIAISVGYLVVVFALNALMAEREPLTLKLFSILHNAVLIALSLYMGVEILRNAIASDMSFVCNRVDRSSETGLAMAKVLYVFYLSKAYEFVDTFIMCLKKKTDQISFLHLYHHAMTFGLWWFGIRFTPGGDSYFSAMLNSFVHVIMYSYYLCAALGIRFPFKKLVTQSQLLQFAINVVQCVVGLYIGCDNVADDYSPRWMIIGQIAYMISFLVLFGMFYSKAYTPSTSDAATKKHKRS